MRRGGLRSRRLPVRVRPWSFSGHLAQKPFKGWCAWLSGPGPLQLHSGGL
jgi:hypothetical protein